jgi:uncharacterized protein YigE (DUF2233 family)
MLPAMIRPALLAAWFASMASLHSLEAGAVECGLQKAAQASFTVCRVKVPDEHLRVFYADSRGVRYATFDALRADLARRGEMLEFAMNAGMFHPDYKPVGLLIIGGKTLAPINRSPGLGNFFLQPNGVFVLDARGARVLATEDYGSNAGEPAAQFATQSGPMLVHLGQINDSGAFRPASRSRNIRNGVCARTPGVVLFVISESAVSFHEFAQFFEATLGCAEALYFDGAISSLYAPALRRADARADLGPLIGVVK